VDNDTELIGFNLDYMQPKEDRCRPDDLLAINWNFHRRTQIRRAPSELVSNPKDEGYILEKDLQVKAKDEIKPRALWNSFGLMKDDKMEEDEPQVPVKAEQE
jgi:hypothetical protein